MGPNKIKCPKCGHEFSEETNWLDKREFLKSLEHRATNIRASLNCSPEKAMDLAKKEMMGK